MIICVDFDGTLVEHRYPRIGAEVPGAFNSLKHFQSLGAKLILYTMRSNKFGLNTLDDAVQFCRERGVEFWGVNQNPEQASWTDSPKVYAHIYIDDAAEGCPLVEGAPGTRPFVDWDIIGPAVARKIEAERTQD